MTTRTTDLLLTALSPVIWGTTYIVTTQFLPNFSPLTVALLRALPAGLLLLLIVRRFPTGIWWRRVFILGALNFSIFWGMLFVSAYRLPGGMAATVGAVQPLIVIFAAALVLDRPIRALSIASALVGLAGVALLVLTSRAAVDPIGVAAGMAGAVSMAFGTVLTRRWLPPVSLLTLTAWQLTAGGVLLIPVVLMFAPPTPIPTADNLIGIGWLSMVGAALTCFLTFRGISRIDPAVVSLLGFLSPVTAVGLGWTLQGESLAPAQVAGLVLVIGSIWIGQRTELVARLQPRAATPR